MGPRLSIRGRGGSRGGSGRGRGRSRGVKHDRWRNRFDNSRLAEKPEDGGEESVEKELSSGNDTTDSEQESEAESETEKKKQTYLALLKSLERRASAPVAKKRKLENNDSENHVAPRELGEGISNSSHEHPGDSEGEYVEGDVDHVDEAEDVNEAEDTDKDEDDSEDDAVDQLKTEDPFESHFSSPNEHDVSNRLLAIEKNEWTTVKVKSNNSRQVFSLPQSSDAAFSPPAVFLEPRNLHLKQKLLDRILQSTKPALEPVEQKLAPLLSNYYDLLFCERTPAISESLRRIVCLHAVNHVFKTRDRVLKNNAKAARADGQDELEHRDQGFTRPKVLMLLPTRQSCARMVETIHSICLPDQQENRKRFDDTYASQQTTVSEDRPEDFRELFDGNDDDMFRLGLKFTRKSIKYFAQFYNSDIILASPLGLRMAMGSDDILATSSKDRNRSKVDYDFLSSIEIVVVDQADALLMQNWEHVEHIFEHLNLQPRDAHGCDFSRVRKWYLDGQARHYRQTISLSAFHTPALAELFRRHANSWAGKVRVQPAEYAGVIGRLGVRGIKQVFSRFELPDVEVEPDARFDYFVKAVMPAILKARGSGGMSWALSGVLIFIPSYLDFVRVRNWFATSAATSNVSFGQVSEYASVPEASRAISHFLSGRHSVLLYTERAHHFRRHQISGVRRVVFYSLPDNPLFYTEIAGGYLTRSQRNQTLELGQGTVRALFSKYDVFKLERIVGSQRVGQMVREQSDTFVFEEEQ